MRYEPRTEHVEENKKNVKRVATKEHTKRKYVSEYESHILETNFFFLSSVFAVDGERKRKRTFALYTLYHTTKLVVDDKNIYIK